MKGLLLFLLISCTPKKEAYTPSERAGKNIFSAHCVRCHGIDGQGGKIANFKLTERASVKDQSAFMVVLKEGVDGTYMRSFSNKLNDSDMESLFLYLSKLK